MPQVCPNKYYSTKIPHYKIAGNKKNESEKSLFGQFFHIILL